MKKFLTALVCAAALLCFGCKEDDGGDGGDNTVVTTLQITNLEKEGRSIYGYTGTLAYDTSSSSYSGTGYVVRFVDNSDDATWNVYLIFEYKDGEKIDPSLGYDPTETTNVTVTKADGKVSFTSGNIKVGINVFGGTLTSDKVFKLVCNNATYSE